MQCKMSRIFRLYKVQKTFIFWRVLVIFELQKVFIYSCRKGMYVSLNMNLQNIWSAHTQNAILHRLYYSVKICGRFIVCFIFVRNSKYIQE